LANRTEAAADTYQRGGHHRDEKTPSEHDEIPGKDLSGKTWVKRREWKRFV
jgi:hypothetical protein